MNLEDIRGMRRRLAESDTYRVADSDAEPTSRRWLKRRDRAGLASNELVILMVILAALALAGTVGFLIVRAVRSGSEHSVLQQNIDQVSGIADSYWDQFAADVDGRRKINMIEFCDYANTQLAAEDVNLRTLQFLDGAAATNRVADNADIDATPYTFDLAGTIVLQSSLISANTATCAEPDGTNITDTQATDLSDVYADIKVADAVNSNRDTHSVDLEEVGLMSTRTVWMAQIGNGGDLGNGTAVTEQVPDGTDEEFGNAASADSRQVRQQKTGVEVLVFGGMAPDGTSFCLIKVFDASENSRIGEYRVSRLPTDNLEFATCLSGVNGTLANEPARGGQWPEAQ